MTKKVKKIKKPRHDAQFMEHLVGVHEESVKETKEKIDAELHEIYKNSDGSLPDMSQFVRGGRFRLVRSLSMLFLACAILGGVVYAGLFVFNRSGSFVEDQISITVAGDEKITPGSDVRYRIRYRNAQKTALTNVAIEVRYPEGFFYKESSQPPVGEPNDRWDIGTLGPDDSGFIDIFGVQYGHTGEDLSIRVFLHYVPESFSSAFQKVATHVIHIDEVPYTIHVEGPQEIIRGADVPLTLSIDPYEGSILQQSALVLTPPEGFRIVKAEPKADDFQSYRWSLNRLGEAKTVKLTAQFAPAEEQQEVTLPMTLVGWPTEQKTGAGFRLRQQIYRAKVLENAIQVTAVVNGATESLSVQPGEVLNASIAIRNSGQTAIQDAQVRAVFDAPSSKGEKSMLNWEELSDEQDGTIRGEQLSVDRRRGIITWTKADITALASIAPGETRIIDISIPIKNREDIPLSEFTTHAAQFVADLQFKVQGEPKIFSSAPIDMAINSDVALEIRQEISTEKFEEDTRSMAWVLTNSFHELKNITLDADVYGDIVFATTSVPAGTVSFDDKQHMRWTIEQMPVSVDVLPLEFVIRLKKQNPSQTQLVSKVELRATDTVTGEEIIIVGDEIGF